MKRLIAFVALGVLCASCGGGGGDSGPAELPPPGGFLTGWERSGETRLFRGAELYGHINGGSEVFLELGFDELEVQRYALGEHEVALELYHMTDPVAALGIYLMKCGEETPDPTLEARHTVSELQLQMVRGPVYVVVNNMTGTEAAGAALLPLARCVAKRIAPADEAPPFELLPEDDRVPGSRRVVRGPYTLEALYTLGRGDLLNLQETATTAVAAAYGEESTHTVLVADYKDPAAAGAAFRSVVDGLDSYLKPLDVTEDRLVFRDWNDEYGLVRLRGGILEVRVHLSSPPE